MLWDIKTNERVFVTGKTSSGKTYFSRSILWQAPRLVVIDPKGLLAGQKDWYLEPDTNAGLAALKRPIRRDKSTGKIEIIRVWVPDPVTDEKWEDLFEYLLDLRNVVIYIDELYGVGPAKRSPGLRSLYTRGREYGIGVWGVSQRPRDIPPYAISEVEYRVVFSLNLLRDRQYLAEMAQNPRVADKLTGHSFFLSGPDKTVKYVKGLNVLKPKIGV